MSVRVLSGAVLIALVGATIWVLPSWATLILAAVVAAIGAREVCGLAAALGARTSSWFVALASAAICTSLGLAPHVLVLSFSHFLLAAIAALIVAAGAVVIFTAPPSKENFAGALAALAAPIYVGFPLGLLALVQAGGTPGRAEVSWLIGMMATSDSAQYFTGRAFGRRKLAPAISPAKTIEGAIGGIVAAAAAGAWLGPLAMVRTSWIEAAMLAAALAVAGMIGDLFESFLKRSAGVKDSGTLIPGHGGLLDRIDSYLFATPAFFVYLWYLQ